jgi:hypothetical protein
VHARIARENSQHKYTDGCALIRATRLALFLSGQFCARCEIFAILLVSKNSLSKYYMDIAPNSTGQPCKYSFRILFC